MKPPWPSTQLQLLLEQPRAMFPRQLEANGRQWSHPGADSRARWPTTTVPQRISATIYTTYRSLLLWYSCNPPAMLLSIQQYSDYDSYIDTAICYVTRFLLIQKSLCYDSHQSQPIYLSILSQPHHISNTAQLLSHGLSNLCVLTIYYTSLYNISLQSNIPASIICLYNLIWQHL